METASLTASKSPLQGAYSDYSLNRVTTPDAAVKNISPAQMQKIDETAQDFEAVFLSQMLEHMFEGVNTNVVTGGGEAEDIYQSMMVEEYGKIIARRGGIGLADHVKRQLLTLQEVE